MGMSRAITQPRPASCSSRARFNSNVFRCLPNRRALALGGWLLLSLLLAPAANAVVGRWEKLDNAVLGEGYMDGDSFHIRHGNKNYIIRLYFVDCPESNEEFKDRNREQAEYFGVSPSRIVPLGNRASQFAKRTLGGKKFTVWTRWQDALGSSRQQRFFGIVMVGKQDFAEALVANGLARVYGASQVLPDGTTANQKFAKLRQLERRAKARRVGAWSKSKKEDTGEGWFELDEEPGAPPAWLDDDEPVGVYDGKWPNVPTVAFLRAEAFINAEQFEDAEIEMRKLVRRFPEHNQKARIEFYLALSMAMQERFEEAIERFQSWLKTWPDHVLAPDVRYWLPISHYYDGQFEKALPLFDKYAAENPMTIYAPEATYRAACCRYALEDYERTADDIAAWLKQNPGHYFRHEAAIMRGDALGALGDLDAAKAAYHLAMIPEAGPFYYMALTQIARVHKALAEEDDYRAMSADYVQFIKDMPNDGNVVDAAYHAGWALRQLGRQEQARTLYWQTIERYGNTPAWEGFDLMLADLATMYPRGADDYARELRSHYAKALEGQRLTLAARLSWAEAQLLPEDQQARSLAVFAGRFKPEYLGPETLLWLGRAWIHNGMPANGVPHLEFLLERFPDTRQVAEAQTLLAKQALDAKNYPHALSYANAVLDNAAEIQFILEATFLRAEALQGIGRFDEAIADYNAILANRAAPRRLKPEALLGIGACLEARNEYAQAVAYYQRIYVLYGAYRAAVVQAYMRSGACFEKTNDRQAAINTYREFLDSDFSPGTAAAAQARQRIAALTGGKS